MLAYMLAAALGYELARRLDHGKLLGFINHFPKADAVLAELKTESWQLILLCWPRCWGCCRAACFSTGSAPRPKTCWPCCAILTRAP